MVIWVKILFETVENCYKDLVRLFWLSTSHEKRLNPN